ncbi:hypothetical protein K7X08_033071 [Anisodus acutangulus]|uniref:Uncharacterized protein n=1 Tax=Anisodus acutangulus TaxID=402998 RepID=A0A9Q1M5X3_9SOLA|nr:hypothetical protein K7X08_033071 [Anisodus acutangulus]
MDQNNQNIDKRVVKTLKNVFGFEQNDSLLYNDGGDNEDSDANFNDGPDPYLDSEDEELNMLAFAEIAKEINMQNQGKENNELNMSDQGSDQEEYGIRRQKMMKMEWMGRPLLMKNFYKIDCISRLEDDMVMPNIVGVDDSDEDDATFIRNPRKVCPRGRPMINRYRGGRGNNFRQGGGRGRTRTDGDGNDNHNGGRRSTTRGRGRGTTEINAGGANAN